MAESLRDYPFANAMTYVVFDWYSLVKSVLHRSRTHFNHIPQILRVSPYTLKELTILYDSLMSSNFTIEHRYNELRRSTPSSNASAALYLGIDTSHYFRTCESSSSSSVTVGILEPQRRVFSFMWNPLESSPSSTSSSTLLNFCTSTDEITRNGYWSSSSQWQTRDCKMKRRSPASTRTCLRRVSLTFVGDSVLGQVSEFLRSGLSSCVAEREELLRTYCVLREFSEDRL